jgi:hypothetical protein
VRTRDTQCTYNVALRRVLETTVAISITYCECVFVDLGIQRAKRMRRIIHRLLAQLYNIFSTLYHKQNDFRKKKVIEH